MKNSFKKHITLYVFILGLVAFILFVFILPSVYDMQCRKRTYDEFDQSLTEQIMSANINIVDAVSKEADGSVITTYGPGSSGVIFKREGNCYYALTAYHVVDDKDVTEYVVIPYGSPTHDEFLEQNEERFTSADYYSQFSRAQTIYSSARYDLAVISFYSDKELMVLPVCENDVKYGEHILSIGNPEGEKFAITFGKVTSKDYYIFNAEKEKYPIKTFKHSAYIAHGSSGGAVFDSNMQIVGINIGGGTDFLGRFRYGVFVPCNLIREFLDTFAEHNG